MVLVTPHIQAKAINLVRYLREVAQLGAKPVKDVKNYEKVLWLSALPHVEGCWTQAWDADAERDEWLLVKKPGSVPELPAECRDWIDAKALSAKTAPVLPETNHKPQELMPQRLVDFPQVQSAWEQYLVQKWRPWDEWRKIYTQLFDLHQELQRKGDAMELVLALGLLVWQPQNGMLIRRHMIVANAVLDFDEKDSVFALKTANDSANLRLEFDMLGDGAKPGYAGVPAEKDLEQAEDNPWDAACKTVLQSLANAFQANGRYENSLEARHQPSDAPVVEYAPALILRKRSTRGLLDVLHGMQGQLDALPLGASIDDAFASLLEEAPAPRQDRDAESQGTEGAASSGEVFFPKPSNEEQRLIVQRLRAGAGVVVQGPPGTGKSHTIANLICHLLATGQRVLITAKTQRALEVLGGDNGLIPENMRPLCISLIGDEQKSLQKSVSGILSKHQSWLTNKAQQEQKRAQYVKKLDLLRRESATIGNKLRDAREAESKEHSVGDGGYQGTAAKIARKINDDRKNYGWLQDRVPEEGKCPISEGVLQQILQALRRFTSEKRAQLRQSWPAAEQMLSAEKFAAYVNREAQAVAQQQEAQKGEADAQLAATLGKGTPDELEKLATALDALLAAHDSLQSAVPAWQEKALQDILDGNDAAWRERLRTAQEAVAAAKRHAEKADASIVFPEGSTLRTLHKDALALHEHLEQGGSLGWGVFRPQAVKERAYLLKSVKIDGQPCKRAEHFVDLADVLAVQLALEKAWSDWKGIVEREEGASTRQALALEFLAKKLVKLLEFSDLCVKCRAAWKNCLHGMREKEPQWGDAAQLDMWQASCRLAQAQVLQKAIAGHIQSADAPLVALLAKGDAHPAVQSLHDALRQRDTDAYKKAFESICILERERHLFDKLNTALARLRQMLPTLTMLLEGSSSDALWDKRLQSFGHAWRWAQAKCWLEKYIGGKDAAALERRSKEIEKEIFDTMAALAESYAWNGCMERMTDEHRQDMVAWQHAMKKLGKGTGKSANKWRRVARRRLNACREAVPAWVMPLHRVWDTVTPQAGAFDVVIVDEASQCGLDALPLLYLGKKILIVGDDKQISPTSFESSAAADALADQYLKDFKFKEEFDVTASIFDFGNRLYSGQVSLREHFRCMPEIINFCSKHFYSHAPLIALRQYDMDRLPPLEHVFVPDGYRKGDVNKPEAQALVERIDAMCKDKRYEGKSMGVVTLQGNEQAPLIEGMLLERIGAAEIQKRRLLCGNPHSFQGDERDIIFLSLVAAPKESSDVANTALTRLAYEQRFNVAVSRARDMLVLFHSVKLDDLSKNCLRYKLLDYFEHPAPLRVAGVSRNDLERQAHESNRSIDKPPAPFDSWFEVDVALELLRRNYVVLPQYQVAGYRIDLVIEGGRARLALECDGDYWHGPERYDDDMHRQRQLERCGWQFFRVRASAFYAGRAESLEKLWPLLRDRGIEPLAQPVESDDV